MSEKKLSPLEEQLNDFFGKLLPIPYVQKVFFVEHLRTMIHAGISLVESLEILSKETENRKLKKMILGVRTQVEQGTEFHTALSSFPKLFPGVYVKMIEAGEISGKLEESLKQVEVQMKKTQELRSTIRGAMIYPAVVVSAMVAVGILMVTVVLPKLLVLFKDFDTELPLATRVLIKITDFMSNPVNLTILAILIGTLIFVHFTLLKKKPAYKRAMHTINLALPIFGNVIREINLARYSLTLSSLLKSAIPITDAVEITGETLSNVRYRNALKVTAEDIKTGLPLSESLHKFPKLFPPIVTEMVMVGERSGEVDELLTELSNFYADQVDKTMKNFATIIEPVIIILLGLAVAGLAVAVVMPMYALVQNF